MLVLKLCQQLCPDKIPVSTSNKLGDGADGEVFDIDGDPDKVVKFCVLYQTGSEAPHTMYKRVSKVLNYLIEASPPTYARVYSYENMGQFTREIAWSKKPQPYVLYYYTMEKLQKISQDEARLFHSLISHEDRGKKKNFTPSQIKEMISGMNQSLDFDAERVTFFIDNFKNTSVSHLDVHMRNIMKDAAGNFKLIDFDRCEMRR